MRKAKMNNLVLSIFPGIDLLGRAFEEKGYCVVRGPDPLWGGDIKSFHPPPGVFEGVIGGPPCQIFSRLRHLNPLAGKKHGNLVPEFERVVAEAKPKWWLMENIQGAQEPQIKGYIVHSFVLNNRWLGAEQHRIRKFWFGSLDGQKLSIDVSIFEHPLYEQAVLATNSRPVPVKLGGSGKIKSSLKQTAVMAGHGPYDRGDGTPQYPKRSIEEMCQLQGLPSDFLVDSPFTVNGKREVIGNAVPMPMARAIAKAIKRSGAER